MTINAINHAMDTGPGGVLQPGGVVVDFWVDQSVVSSGDGLTRLTAKKTITEGTALMTGTGQRLRIVDGTYSDPGDWIQESDADAAAGALGAYNIIEGESIGGVEINQTLGLRYSPTGPPAYLEFHNLIWHAPLGFGDSTDVERWALDRQFVKWFNCGVDGGALGGNSGTCGTEENQLLEDCWFFGWGGRTIMSAFNTTNVVFRRCLFRFDSAWGWLEFGNDEPISIFTMYVQGVTGSANLACQNCIFIDAQHFTPPETLPSQGQATANITSNSPGQNQTDMFLHGNIFMNIVGFQGGGFLTGGSQTVPMGYVEMRDNLYMNLTNGITLSLDSDSDPNSLIQQCLFHNCSVSGVNQQDNTVAAAWDVDQCIFNDVAVCLNNGSNGLVGTYNNYWNFSSGDDGSDPIYTDPMANGMSYPIEAAGSLATSGAGGTRVGPDITKKLGVSGTLYGDAGWDTTTTDDLWPWPNETVIRDELRKIQPTIQVQLSATGYTSFVDADIGRVFRNDTDAADIGTIVFFNNAQNVLLVASTDWNVPSVPISKDCSTVGSATGIGTTSQASTQASPSGKRGFCDDTTSIGGSTMSLTYYIVEAMGVQESGIY